MIRRTLLLGLFIATLSLPGQDRFQAVKQALALTNDQISRIETHADPMLNDAQRTKLASIRKVLSGDVAHLAARLGLINRKDWEQRFGQTCVFGEVWPYIYYTERYRIKPWEVYLSTAQAERLEHIQRQAPLPRDIVMSILDPAQKAKFAAFEEQVQIAAEAVQLGLIESAGEILCH